MQRRLPTPAESNSFNHVVSRKYPTYRLHKLLRGVKYYSNRSKHSNPSEKWYYRTDPATGLQVRRKSYFLTGSLYQQKLASELAVLYDLNDSSRLTRYVLWKIFPAIAGCLPQLMNRKLLLQFNLFNNRYENFIIMKKGNIPAHPIKVDDHKILWPDHLPGCLSARYDLLTIVRRKYSQTQL